MPMIACGRRSRVALACGVLISAQLGVHTPVAAQVGPANPAGHAIAEKFARDGEDAEKARLKKKADSARREQDRRKAEETDMLAQARKEAADRQAEQDRARTRAEAEQRAVDAQAIEAARIAAEKKVTDDARIAAEKKAADDARIAAEKKAADDALTVAMQESARRAAMEAERNREVDRLSERLRQAREAHVAKSERTQPSVVPNTAPSPAIAPVETATSSPVQTASISPATAQSRFTIIVWMEPGNRGIRRTNKSADPLLCSPAGCYVSNGPGEPASFRPGRKALGFAATFGSRAGACSNHLGCVFRDIDPHVIGTFVQPVDMRVMHHDRREAFSADTTSDCTARPGHLTCRRTIAAVDYTIWIVPEAVAAEAGPEALDRLANDAAPHVEQAALPPIPVRHH